MIQTLDISEEEFRNFKRYAFKHFPDVKVIAHTVADVISVTSRDRGLAWKYLLPSNPCSAEKQAYEEFLRTPEEERYFKTVNLSPTEYLQFYDAFMKKNFEHPVMSKVQEAGVDPLKKCRTYYNESDGTYTISED